MFKTYLLKIGINIEGNIVCTIRQIYKIIRSALKTIRNIVDRFQAKFIVIKNKRTFFLLICYKYCTIKNKKCIFSMINIDSNDCESQTHVKFKHHQLF